MINLALFSYLPCILITMGNFIIINETEKSQCEVCNEFFDPQEADSPNGEYHELCEMRAEANGPFPTDLPKSAKINPYVFCSRDCEEEACDQVRVGRMEFRRMVEEGEIEDTPCLDYDQLGGY